MNSFSSSQMTPSCKSAFMAFRHRSRSSKKRLYAPANYYANYIRPCPSGKCLARKHNQTSFGDQTHVDFVSVNRKYWHIINLDLVITTITKRKKLLFY